MSETTEEFIEEFCRKLHTLKWHDYIAKNLFRKLGICLSPPSWFLLSCSCASSTYSHFYGRCWSGGSLPGPYSVSFYWPSWFLLWNWRPSFGLFHDCSFWISNDFYITYSDSRNVLEALKVLFPKNSLVVFIESFLQLLHSRKKLAGYHLMLAWGNEGDDREANLASSLQHISSLRLGHLPRITHRCCVVDFVRW